MKKQLVKEVQETIPTFGQEEMAVTKVSNNEQLEQFINPTLQMYSSVKDDGTRASKVKLYNLMSNPSKKLADVVNTVLNITEVIAQPIQLVSDETGDLNDCMRIILIDDNGEGYACVSQGVTSALTKIFDIFGQPSWEDEPIKMTPKNVKVGGNRSVLTIELTV